MTKVYFRMNLPYGCLEKWQYDTCPNAGWTDKNRCKETTVSPFTLVLGQEAISLSVCAECWSSHWVVRFSDSLAPGRASGLGNLTTHWVAFEASAAANAGFHLSRDICDAGSGVLRIVALLLDSNSYVLVALVAPHRCWTRPKIFFRFRFGPFFVIFAKKSYPPSLWRRQQLHIWLDQHSTFGPLGGIWGPGVCVCTRVGLVCWQVQPALQHLPQHPHLPLLQSA